MAVAQRISEQEYEQIVLADPVERWELIDGRLREKPGMSWDHGRIVSELIYLLRSHLDPRHYQVFAETRVRRTVGTIFLPDVMVVPTEYGRELAGRPVLAIFSQPLPFVIEIWSPSTGDYDVDTKIPEYQGRGDLEIWRVHPYEKTLTVWRRQPDGSYHAAVHTQGAIAPLAFPEATISLPELFDD